MAAGAHHLCKTAEWFTPAPYVDAGRRVLAGFDLDPASCAKANRTVRARRYYTRRQNGLRRRWFGRVWINPPGDKSGELVAAYWERFEAHYLAGEAEGIWCGFSLNQLSRLQNCSELGGPLGAPRVCITNHRIQFIKPNGKPATQPGHANYFALLSRDEDRRRRFEEEFSAFGVVVEGSVLATALARPLRGRRAA